MAANAIRSVPRQLLPSLLRTCHPCVGRFQRAALRIEGSSAVVTCKFNAWILGTRAFSVQNTPSFGAESITEGTVLEWKVKVGDQVKKEDILCSIETDKVSLDATASQDGYVQEIHIKEGDTAEVGKPLLTYADSPPAGAPSAGASAPASASSPAPAAPTGQVVEVTTPDFGSESIVEGTVQSWKVKVGEAVAKGTVLCEIETDKVTVDLTAPDAGAVTEIFLQQEDTAKIGDVMCKFAIGSSPGALAPAASAPAPAAAPAVSVAGLKGIRLGLAQAAARRAGVEPAVAEVKAVPAPAKAPAPAPATFVKKPGGRGEHKIKMTPMRQAICRRLKDAQNTTAMLTTFQEVDMSAIIAMQKEYQELFEKEYGVKLSIMSAFCKATAYALQKIPGVNAFINDAKQEIIYRDYVDISVPVASPRGLVVPVIRNVGGLALSDIEKAIADVALKARKDALSIDDMTGGTFTISDEGAFGSMMGTPIVNQPQSAIMGMHATKNRAVVLKNGSIAGRPVMYLALTYDHRLIDGREAVTFLCTVRDQIEDPRRMLLGL
mmetsp:Transcript_30282/g.69684  ORF Transcript_30282/g.69684 Transcript_30282/m.69684 type:complete len:549 (-) Transcript_30282:71-1717(-)